MKLINGWTKDSIRKHLEANFQGKSEDTEASSDPLACRYRLADKKCVVGCFIPDEVYHPSMEGKIASDVIKENRLQTLMPLSSAEMNNWQAEHDILDPKSSISEQIQKLMNCLN